MTRRSAEFTKTAGSKRGSRDAAEIRVGVSACLLGESVRYDGGHKRDAWLTETLARRVRFVPVCPEMAIGMGVPREPVQLVRRRGGVRMIATRSGTDHTDAMRRWARGHLDELERARLHGFVLKSNSPSCGLLRVPLHRARGPARRDGRGLFAEALVERFALLPVEEEGRLRDPALRENFVERLFAYERWTRLLDEDPTPRGLAAFHAAHEPTLTSHSPAASIALGRIVSRAGREPWARVSVRYGTLFLRTFAVPATRASRG